MSEIELSKDFKEQTIVCNNCSKKLMNYAIVAPNEPIKHSLIIACPFCNTETDCISIQGLISRGPIGSDQSAYPTIILDEDLGIDNIWRIKLGKR